ncbi:MAG: hypothetical protein ACRC3Y_05545 [Romboutsia sp.]|uniref:hypothetical protein n=1 Tax=Romboutsia sp. TaxID=1965302 RepID=UPI003F2FC8E5
MNIMKCTLCGCEEIGEGNLEGFKGLVPQHGLPISIPIVADVCTNCGNILSMRVTKPEKFKK